MKRILYLLLIGFVCFSCEESIDPSIPEHSITTLPKSINSHYEEGTAEIFFKTNRSWTATSDDAWISIDKVSGEAIIDHEIITATIEQNPLSSDRSGTITFLSEGVVSKVTITQTLAPPVFYAVDSTAQEKVIELISEVEIKDISISADWVKYDKDNQAGMLAKQYKFTIEALEQSNPESERSATVEFINMNDELVEKVIFYQSKLNANITFDNANSTSKVSTSLIGFNVIYSHSPDDFFANTEIKTVLTDVGTHFLRWPGGAPTNRYHWNNLNGHGWKDNWFDNTPALEPSMYTDLDEYISICRSTGATPLVGINQGSGLRGAKEQNATYGVEEGIAEAKALVQYCKDKGYDVNNYYLDNEPYHVGANFKMSAAVYIEQIKLYAPEIKKINPDAKIIINWEKIRSNSLWEILEGASEHIDIVEIHWYWMNGEAKFDTWKNQIPMNSKSQWYTAGLSYINEIKYFYSECAKLGYDHIKLASLEWNVGQSKSFADYPTKYENTIMQAEMLMQFMAGGLEYATFWPIFWPKQADDNSYSPNRYLMDPTQNYELSPSVDMFSMLSQAQGKNIRIAASNKNIVFPLMVENDAKSEMQIFTHSKSNKGIWINLTIEEYAGGAVYELLQPTSSTDRDSGLKEILPSEAVIYNAAGGYYRYYLPAYSLGYLKLTK